MDTAIFILFLDRGPSSQYLATAFVFVYLWLYLTSWKNSDFSWETLSFVYCSVPPLPPGLLSHRGHLFLLTCSSSRCESTAVPPPCQKPLFRSPPPPPVCLSVCIAGELKCGAPRPQAVASVIYKYENLLAQEISRANPSRPTEAALDACQRNVRRASYLPNRPRVVFGEWWWWMKFLPDAVKCQGEAAITNIRMQSGTCHQGEAWSLRRPCSSQLINYHPVGSDTWRYYNGIWPHQPGTTE